MNHRAGRAALLSLAFICAVGCGSDPNERLDRVEDLLPPEVELAVTIDGLAALHEAIDVDSIAAAFPTITARVSQALVREFGIDLLDLHAAQSAGVDPDGRIGVAVTGAPDRANVIALPGDGQRLADHLRDAYARRNGAPPTSSSYAGLTLLDASRSNATIITFEEFAVIVSGVLRADARRRVCETLIDEVGKNCLDDSDGYRATAKEIDGQIRLYRSPRAEERDSGGLIARTPLRQFDAPLFGHPLGFGARHNGAACGVRLTNSSVQVTTATELVEAASPKPKAKAERAHLDRLPAHPKLAFNSYASGRELLRWLFPNGDTPALLAPIADPETPLGGLFAELEGHIGLLVNEVKLFGSDVVVYGDVPDSAAARRALDAVAEDWKTNPMRLPIGGTTAKIERDATGGSSFYRLPMFPVAEVCFGIVGEQLVIASTRERFDAIVRGGESFLSSVRDESYAAAVSKGSLAALYVDLPAATQALSSLPTSWAPQMQNIRRILSPFDTAVVHTDLEGMSLRGSWSLRSDRSGVWVELIETLLGSHAG